MANLLWRNTLLACGRAQGFVVARHNQLRSETCLIGESTLTHQKHKRKVLPSRYFSFSPAFKSPATAPKPIPHLESSAKQSRDPESHYDFFPESIPSGPPPRGPFKLDLKSLRNEFLQIQASAHPDRHPGKAKRRAEALSARVNEAYKTLQDPLLRAQYILSLKGIDVAGDETAKLDGANAAEDKELLMQVMEDREEIEESMEEKELRFVRERNVRRLGESVKVLETAFDKGNWELAKREAVRLRYWVNIKEAIDNWEKGKPVLLAH